jgi:[FeFe] hydrogenase H-cluster maturation GTPase HydF
MKSTPRSLRLHIGLFGRTNVGKSSFLNMVAGQERAITSPRPGTTTDVVEKTMELLPLGPVVIYDTAGLDDISELASRRIEKTMQIFDRIDVAVLIAEPGVWEDCEERILAECESRKVPIFAVINKCDLREPDASFVHMISSKTGRSIACSAVDGARREHCVNLFKRTLIDICPEAFMTPPSLVGDLLPPGGLVTLVVPIDLQAPRGRLILPQVQTIRDALDNDADLVEAVTTLLEAKGYEVVSAPNGEEGLKKAKEELPDLMLLDVMMTRKDEGFDISRALKSDEKLRQIPVIMVTGITKEMNLPFKFEPDDQWLPVKAVLEKPVKPEVLLKTIEDHIKK